MNSTEKMEMQVSEEQDGSAVISLPPDEAGVPQNDGDNGTPHQENASGAQESDEEDDIDASEGTDDDREAIRAARREERKLKKQIHREKARESNHLISALKKQNSELAERLAVLEKRTSGAELARLDKAIDDAGTRVEYAKMKLQEAVNAGNGADVTKAQQMWYDSQRQLESLQTLKENANKQMSQPRQNNIKAPDLSVQRMATKWMERNEWYDPQMRDPDSRIAQTIDQALTEEGFDPSSPDYWDELDDRLQKYLPHRYNSGYNSNNRNQKPRSIVTGSGREQVASTKAGEFKLSAERVNALKEAGLWNNPEARKNAIRKYAEWDRQNKDTR